MPIPDATSAEGFDSYIGGQRLALSRGPAWVILTLLLIGVVLGGALPAAKASDDNKGTTKNQMKVTIGQKTFIATLENNATVTAFTAMLPLTLNMNDFNDNEKVIRLSGRLPTHDSNPRRIQIGDLMIWSSHSLVLFYKSFPTSYSYTRLGRIDDPSGLADAVGSGNVTVRFELR